MLEANKRQVAGEGQISPSRAVDSVAPGQNPHAQSAHPNRFEDAAEAVVFYLGKWWTNHGKVIQGLLGDLILYVCLYGYLALISLLINRFGLGPEYQQLLQYGILITDGVILLMFIRKVVITLWNV